PDLSVAQYLSIQGPDKATRLRHGGLRLGLSTAGGVIIENIDFTPTLLDNATLSSTIREASVFDVNNCPGLKAVELGNLDSLGASLTFMDNKDLNRMSSSLSKVGAITISGNGRAAELSLPNLVTIVGNDGEESYTTDICHLFKLEMPKLKDVS